MMGLGREIEPSLVGLSNSQAASVNEWAVAEAQHK